MLVLFILLFEIISYTRNIYLVNLLESNMNVLIYTLIFILILMYLHLRLFSFNVYQLMLVLIKF